MTIIKPAFELIAVGGALFVLFHLFRHRPPLNNVVPMRKREIEVDFDKQRVLETKRIDALEKQDLLVELNRSRNERDK